MESPLQNCGRVYDLSEAISNNDREEVEALTRELRSRKGNGGKTSPEAERRKSILFHKGYNEKEWNRMLTALVKFRKEHKHTAVPPLWEEDPDLAMWAQRQQRFSIYLQKFCECRRSSARETSTFHTIRLGC